MLELSEELNRALESRNSVRNGKSDLADTNSYPTSQSNSYERIVDNAVALMRSDYASMQMLFPERGSGGELRLLAFRGFNPKPPSFGSGYAQTRRVHVESRSATRAEWLRQT